MQLSAILRQSPLALAGKMVRRSIFAVRTGYWHTCERSCPGFPDGILLNDQKVYRFAAQFCGGGRILDVGCGTGHGTSHLAESATTAVGIDLSAQAIRYARRQYRSPNLRFLRMNAESLAFPDRNFDFIITSENLEHLHDQRANIREMARVLTDEGMLLLATPNREMFLDGTSPYHTHEFFYDELLELMQEFFGECVISENLLTPSTEEGQRTRKGRQGKGLWGINLSVDPILWSKAVDITWLSNTHSFFSFARKPRRRA